MSHIQCNNSTRMFPRMIDVQIELQYCIASPEVQKVPAYLLTMLDPRIYTKYMRTYMCTCTYTCIDTNRIFFEASVIQPRLTGILLLNNNMSQLHFSLLYPKINPGYLLLHWIYVSDRGRMSSIYILITSQPTPIYYFSHSSGVYIFCCVYYTSS